MEKKAVKLNEVEGFDPMVYARTIDNNGESALYLDVQYRVLWFRLRYPNGKIVVIIHTFDGNLAVVEVRIYADKADAEDNYLSNAFAQRFYDPNTDYGARYLETAETAAVGRALAKAGFGLQFAIEKDPSPVDSGQRQPVQAQAQQYQPVQVQAQSQPYSQQAQPQSQAQVQPQQAPQQSQGQPQAQYPQYAGMSFEDVRNRMSYNEAAGYIYRTRNGKSRHEGETLGTIAANDFANIVWLVDKYAGTDAVLKAAACIIHSAHTQQQG